MRKALAASIALSCLISPHWARADDAQLQQLRQQIEALQNTVRALQERVDALEKNAAASWVPATPEPKPAGGGVSAAPESAAQPAAAVKEPAASKMTPGDRIALLRESWRHVSAGMTQADVMDTLGPPTREMSINGKLVWYYYYAGLGAGSVFFNRDGRISSSQSPHLGWGS